MQRARNAVVKQNRKGRQFAAHTPYTANAVDCRTDKHIQRQGVDQVRSFSDGSLPLAERHIMVGNLATVLGNRQLQKQLLPGVVQTQAVTATLPTKHVSTSSVASTITEADKQEFALLEHKIADDNVVEYVQHRAEVFGSTEAYLYYAVAADQELDGTKGLRALIELRHDPAAQTILYRWLRKTYQDKAGISDVPALIKQGQSKELKEAIKKVKTAYGKTFRSGGFNPRPKKNAQYRFRLGTVSEHGLGKAVDIEAGKNPILSKKDWSFIEQLAGKQVDRHVDRWWKTPEALWKDINELNQLFVAKVFSEVTRIEGERTAVNTSSQPKAGKGKKLLEPLDEVFAKHKPLKKWKAGFFTLEWTLVKGLHEQGMRWGATFGNAVDLHHFEL